MLGEGFYIVTVQACKTLSMSIMHQNNNGIICTVHMYTSSVGMCLHIDKEGVMKGMKLEFLSIS